MGTAVQADVFIHLASTFDADMARIEPVLFASLSAHLQTRPQPLRLLYTGGCWLFGETRNAVADEASPLRPIPAFEWAAQAIAELDKIPNLSCAVMHPAMVYSDTGGVFSRMITALRAGRPAPIWGGDHTRWPLVHRDDLAAAYLLLATTPSATGTFNIVAEKGVPVGEIAETLATAAGVKARPAVLPAKWVRARHGPWSEGPMLDQQMRSARMDTLGWSPVHTDYSTRPYRF